MYNTIIERNPMTTEIDPATLDLATIQERILAGEQLTPEEYRAVIARLRGDRQTAAATSRTKKAAAAPCDLNADLDALFGVS